jgi:hypothetical protein
LATRHVPAILGDCHIAGVQANPHLDHHFQVPQVELGDPPIARGKENVAAVPGELGTAVQRVAARKAVDRFEPVTIQDGHVMVAAFHHQEQIHEVASGERRCRSVGQAARRVMNYPGGA